MCKCYQPYYLTHRRGTDIYVSKLCHRWLPARRPAIIWTYIDLLSIVNCVPSVTNFSEIWTKYNNHHQSKCIETVIWEIAAILFRPQCIMMTSSNGTIFRVTGHLCGESPVPGEFPKQRPVTRSFDEFLYLRLNIRLSKQSWGWWFETQSGPLWRHSNVKTFVHWNLSR